MMAEVYDISIEIPETEEAYFPSEIESNDKVILELVKHDSEEIYTIVNDEESLPFDMDLPKFMTAIKLEQMKRLNSRAHPSRK